MKKILFLILIVPLLVVAQTKKPGVLHETEIIRVVDGDTIVISAYFLPEPLKPQLSVRIYGVDTPEKGNRAQCDQEKTLGEIAGQWTKNLVANGQRYQLVLYDWDKFGGRVLGDIIVDGQSVRQGLIAAGLAREYYGDKKQSWCN